MKTPLILPAVAALSALTAAAGTADSDPHTTVLKWKDGKQAAFLLAFDDSCASHVDKAIPEMQRRGIPGTFYINPGNGPYKGHLKTWETTLPALPGIEYGNHTFSHKGATNAVQLDTELAMCSAVIDRCFPDRRKPRLVSFGRPGGVPWTVTDAEKKAALAKYHLVERPAFWGAAIHVKTETEMSALVDNAIARGEVGHLDFHGVGGDWLMASMAFFTAFLDKLEACRDQLWVTDHITCHKYQTERSTARTETTAQDGARIAVRLICESDPALYDQPLTLRTTVPAGWKRCRITQGTVISEQAVTNGTIQYDARPCDEPIVLVSAN